MVRLVPNYVEIETEYFRRTGIFPIMHFIAIKRPLFERHPWMAVNCYKAFEEAKDRSIARIHNMMVSHFPLPWNPDNGRRATEMFGQDCTCRDNANHYPGSLFDVLPGTRRCPSAGNGGRDVAPNVRHSQVLNRATKLAGELMCKPCEEQPQHKHKGARDWWRTVSRFFVQRADLYAGIMKNGNIRDSGSNSCLALVRHPLCYGSSAAAAELPALDLTVVRLPAVPEQFG